MAILTYDPATGHFENGGSVETPGTGDTVVFGANGGVAYAFTVEAGFDVAQIDATSIRRDRGGAGRRHARRRGDRDRRQRRRRQQCGELRSRRHRRRGRRCHGARHQQLLDLLSAGHLVVNDNATVISSDYDFAVAGGTPASQFGVSIGNGASLFLNAPTSATTGLDLTNAPAGTFNTNTTGALTVGNLTETSAQFVALDKSVSGSGSFTFLGQVGGVGQTLDTTQLTYPVIFGSELVPDTSEVLTSGAEIVNDSGTGEIDLVSALRGLANMGGPNFIPMGVEFDGVDATGDLTLTEDERIVIIDGMLGNAHITFQGGSATSMTDAAFNGLVWLFEVLPITPTISKAVVLSGIQPAITTQNLFSAEFVSTTFGPNSPITVTGPTEFDATGGGITLDNQTEVSDASAQFDGQLSIEAGGLLYALDAGSVTLQSDLVNNGDISLAGGSSLNLQDFSPTQPGLMDFLGANNGVNFAGTGVAATLTNFGDSDLIDIGSGPDNSDFGPGSTVSLTGNLLDVLNNAGSVIAAFTLQRTDSFVYKQSDFQVNTDNNGGTLLFTSGVADVACFAAGTHILTAEGEVPVEKLREGDLVPVRGALLPIVWIGHRRVDCTRQQRPVRVAAHAFAPGRPHRPLLLSPDHGVLIGKTLVPVRHLVNGASIAQVPIDEVTYYHVELPRHEVLLAEGLACESFLDTGNRAAFGREPARHPRIQAAM